MRYKLLGDILNIKSALFYKRGYVDVTFKRHPYIQMNSIKVNKSNRTSFMEYSFKFDIDKGPYSSYNLYDNIGTPTFDVFKGDSGFSIPENLLMYQVGSSDTRNYSFFEVFSTDDLTEMVLNADPEVQKIEFFKSELNYSFNEDGLIDEVEEYVDTETSITETPILIVEFGPEISYEPEDYYNKDEMESKPLWDESSEKSYQMKLEEYSNNKLLFISISSDSSVEINLSLNSHKSQINPHRFQNNYVVRNKDLKSDLIDTKNTLSSVGSLLIDNRSNTLLGTEKITSHLPLLSDRKNNSIEKIEVTIGEGDNSYIKEFNIYKDYIEYNKNDEVYYKGEVFISLIDGNIYENPSISPMWSLIDTSYVEPPIEIGFHSVNIRVNDENLGTTDPIGLISVEDSHELYVKLISEKAKVTLIELDGESQRLPESDTYTLSNVIKDHDLLITFTPIYINVELQSSPDESYGFTIGSGSYIRTSDVNISAIPNEGYKFDGWYDEDGNLIDVSSNFTIYRVIDDTVLIAKFSRIKFNVEINCNKGGTFTPFNGIPTNLLIDYGDNLNIFMIPNTGYEIDYYSINSVNYKYSNEPYIRINDIREDISVSIYFSRYRLSVTDPILGKIYYFIVGDQIWSIDYINYDNLGIKYNDIPIRYYNGSEVTELDKILESGNTGFRVPTLDDINKLYNLFDDKLVGLNLKSQDIIRFNKYGWKDSIFRGLGKYRLDFMPYGYIYNLKDDLIHNELNESSNIWTSYKDKVTNTGVSSIFNYNSPIGSISKMDLDNCYLNIKVMSDIPKINILGTEYRYITISHVVSVLDDEETKEYEVTQSWMLDNLDYTDLGVRFEESESEKFGSLYDLSSALEIDNLVKDTEFRVPSNLDYVLLEKFLGYGRDELIIDESENISIDENSFLTGYIGTVEGKRLKAGDYIYSGINWNGYSTRDYENSQLNYVPSGYAEVSDTGDILYKGMGTECKFWTRSHSDMTSYSRSISYSSDKILRGLDQGSKVLMSIRLVSTKIKLLE